MANIKANREQLTKNLTAPDFKGLSTDYPSFDLLWFDIETKTRHLMEELLDPIVDRLVSYKDSINQVKTDGQKATKKIEELKDTIFNTNNKLDVFEQLNLRIA